MTERTSHLTRRTEGVRTRGRSARVVEEVLRATLEEIGQRGYQTMRIEDVAARSGVNKTTIYRRWPTKLDLLAAAVRHFAPVPAPPETGTLRGDLLVLLRTIARKADTPTRSGMIRMFQTEREHPDVDKVMRPLHAEQMALRRGVIERAIGRGELPEGIDVDLVLELMFAPVIRRVMLRDKRADDAFIETTVDVVLSGVRSGAAQKKPRPAPSSTRTRARA
jgi:AcrR family transcriptional regulator